MSAVRLHRISYRRGTVLVMVVAVLAMLFIVGTSQLMMARFERKLAVEKTLGTQTKETAAVAVVPPASNFGEDARGADGVAYNRGWNAAETSLIEDGADFTGVPMFLPTDTAQERLQKAARAGDLLLSSTEPHWGTDANGVIGWIYPFMSWSKDAISDLNNTPGNIEANELPGSIEMGVATASTEASPIVGTGSPLKGNYVRPLVGDYYRDSLTGDFCADVDGDGIVDGRRVGSMAGCDLYQRVVSHGGMVTLDRMTHPALLAQVIHPSDTLYHSQPWSLFNTGQSIYWNGTLNDSIKAEDEARLRRRFMLPGSTVFNSTDWEKLSVGDLRKLLPYTLGYLSVDGSQAPHYWRVGSWPVGMQLDLAAEKDWWEKRITPGRRVDNVIVPMPALTETGYNKATDTYDRRHLLTTHNSDDLLRPNRNEARLLKLPTNVWNTFTANAEQGAFYYLINPETTAGTDIYGNQTRPSFAYGMVGGQLLFNKPGLRTPFSLRDVLEKDGSGNEIVTSRRIVQLTAYYLAMIQHTSAPGSSSNIAFDPITHAVLSGTMNPTSLELTKQLRMAAQLAVNTIDFADSNQSPTYFQYPASSPVIKVAGIEKQPYITEAYAKVVKYKPSATEPVNTDSSRFAVELYNPYSVALDLSQYTLNDIPLDGVILLAGGGTWDHRIPALSYLVFVNKADDPSYNATHPPSGSSVAGMNPPFDPANPNAVVLDSLKLSSHLVGGGGVQYVQLKRRIRDDATLLKFNENGQILQTDPTHASLPVEMVVDSMGQTPGVTGNDNIEGVELGAEPSIIPPDGKYTVRHTSLQRCKETDPANPIGWRFTLAVQRGFDSELTTNPYPPVDYTQLAPESFEPTSFHGLLNTADKVLLTDKLCPTCPAAGDATVSPRFYDLAPMPIITSDAGLISPVNQGLAASSTLPLAAAAFPTTGTLLLVTRDGHLSFNGEDMSSIGPPLTVMASTVNGVLDIPGETGAMIWLDHGHMPVFDTTQMCTDKIGSSTGDPYPQGRLDVPWGQLVFSYFTTLPIEELTNAWLLDAPDQATYEDRYRQAFGMYVPASSGWLPGEPVVDREAGANSPYGPSVRGRINLNLAPWWVLDGLPVLPDAYRGTTTAVPANSWSVLAGLPTGLPLQSSLLDPSTYPVSARAGMLFLNYLMDDTPAEANTTAGLPTMGPAMARSIVSWRENRVVDGIDAGNSGGSPGILTPATLCNIVPNVVLPNPVQYGGTNLPVRFADLRSLADPTDTTTVPERAKARPYHYLGYLQMIAPIVRLQDWATTKSHVYTVYNLVTDNNGTWLRSQTTIDRTRCLYSNDLPNKITSIDPINYFNVMGDQ